MSLKVKDFLICDDVRLEAGNKYSPMGVYGDRINVNFKAPLEQGRSFKLPLSLFIRLLKDPKAELAELDFKIAIDFKGNPIGEVVGKASLADNAILPLAIRKLEFELAEGGVLKFALTILQNTKTVLTYEESIRVEVT